MSDSKQSMRPLVGSASMLVIGIVIGLAVDRMAVIHGHVGPHSPGVVVIGNGETDTPFRELAEHLDLTEEQAAEAHEIFLEHQASVDTAWTAVQDHLALAIANVMSELDSLLDVGQRGRLRQWVAERHGTLPIDSVGGG